MPLAHTLAHPFLRYRFGVFFVLLLALVLIPPYFQTVQEGDWFDEVSRVMLTFSTIWALSAVARNRTALILAGVLMLPHMISTWLGTILEPSMELQVLDNLTTIVYFALICAYIGMFILRSHRVNAEVLFAAMCLYITIALLWASIFANLEVYYADEGGAFTFYGMARAEAGIASEDLFSVLMYYSFVTLSTLGYGDIIPVHPVAQNWAAVEAMMGQFFIAIVIARLVSLYTIESEEKRGSPDA